MLNLVLATGLSIVKLPSATPTMVTAILKHEKSGVHAHLMIEASAEAPHKITDMQLRPARPDEIGGQVGNPPDVRRRVSVIADLLVGGLRES